MTIRSRASILEWLALYLFAFDALMLFACGSALVLGGAPERIVAVAFIVAATLSPLVGETPAGVYHAFSPGVFLVDLAALVLLIALGLASTRFWTMLMASMQCAEVLAHLAVVAHGGAIPGAYGATVVFWSYPMLILLAVATWRHRRRIRRYGRDPAWARQLPNGYRQGRSADERLRVGRPVPA